MIDIQLTSAFKWAQIAEELILPDTLPRPRPNAPDQDGGPYVVVLYNCDCHTFDEVIAQVQLATGCAQARAEQIAEEAHNRGRAIAHTGPEADCERAAAVLRRIGLQVETDRF